MEKFVPRTEPVSLWDCLHDGKATAFESDLLARQLTVIIDADYHWEFNNLPPETRFRLVAENTRICEVFEFEPWPGAIEPTRETPWDTAQALRRMDYEKGRLVSSNWNTFVTDVTGEGEFIVSAAELIKDAQIAVLELGIMKYPESDYSTVRIQAERFVFYVGNQELGLKEFLKFGSSYWQNFANRSNEQVPQKDTHV